MLNSVPPRALHGYSINPDTAMKTDSHHDLSSPAAAASVAAHALPVYAAYDISECRRRNRLRRLLFGFGEPLQESVFLCWLDPLHQRRLEKLLDTFRQLPHAGDERIDCIPARTGSLQAPAREWVIE
ncbi:hypothetical protein ACCAA_130002 [Candidatus Accumulibacter aalborgensis]|uniref:Uncharacterized protein n=2 Tax=Candidatus Accumulibacter aalborgensis TaxID=1860102 RepID=A0A1A8XFQ6_9PROT|nr:hypothetical protein ACCAA_130002 [Candidatus Accumulibacter aalborgensis]